MPSDDTAWFAASGALAAKSGGMNAGNGARMRTIDPAVYDADIADALKATDAAGLHDT